MVSEGNLGLNEGNIGLFNPQCNHLASEHLDHAAEQFGVILLVTFFPLLELKGNMFMSTSTD